MALFLPSDPLAYRAPEPKYGLRDAQVKGELGARLRTKRRVVELLEQRIALTRLEIQHECNVPKSVVVSMIEDGQLVEVKEHSGIKGDAETQFTTSNSRAALSDDQLAALQTIREIGEDVLLYGVTGSGKTEIYLSLIGEALEKGKRALFLLPEISLTPQMMARVKNRFSDRRIAVVHSKISELERNTIHRDIALGAYDIVIGARSALFAPLDDIGVIIVDECHERSFRSEHRPRYDAVEAARFLARQHDALFLCGSATPNVDDCFRYQATGRLVTLDKRFNDYEVPRPTIVDLRRESDKVISSSLHLAIEDRLARGEQTILFLNRKGYSGLVVCGHCGFQYQCPNCDISLTSYLSERKMECRYCGHREILSQTCPECGSDEFGFIGIGTERIENLLRERYPQARIARLDRSVVTSHGRLQEILEQMESREIDILIGTQIIAKGFDFPYVTLVGILAADLQLRFPSYLASERAFQVFTQVSGRAGRSGLRSEVLLQTYSPDHYTLKHADFPDFYAKELEFRKELQYPPFRDLYLLTFSDEVETRALQSAMRTRNYLERSLEHKNLQNEVKIFQVLPASLKKMGGQYRYQLLLSSGSEVKQQLMELLARLEDKLNKTKLSSITIDIGAKE